MASIIGIITALLPVALQILGWFIQRAKVSEEAKEAFFSFVKKAAKDIGSVKLMEYGDRQLEWLKQNPWKPGVN
jgi:hypothetical protein